MGLSGMPGGTDLRPGEPELGNARPPAEGEAPTTLGAPTGPVMMLRRLDLGVVPRDEMALDPWRPDPPDAQFPENLYTYRYSLLSKPDLEILIEEAIPNWGSMDPMVEAHLKRAGMETVFQQQVEYQVDPDTILIPVSDADQFVKIDPSFHPSGHFYWFNRIFAYLWLDVMKAWRTGNEEFRHQRYASAVNAYDKCQKAMLRYLATSRQTANEGDTMNEQADDALLSFSHSSSTSRLHPGLFQRRYDILSLKQLREYDWTPLTSTSLSYAYLVHWINEYEGLFETFPQFQGTGNELWGRYAQRRFDVPLWVLLFVLVPLARAEANRLRRQYADALIDVDRVLRSEIRIGQRSFVNMIRNPWIETPFAQLLRGDILADQAEAQFKARLSVADQPDPAVRAAAETRLISQAQEFNAAGLPQGSPQPFQNLRAAATYCSLIDGLDMKGRALAHIRSARDASVVRTAGPEAATPAMLLPAESGVALSAANGAAHPHAPLLSYSTAANAVNPRCYALLFQAQARLLQMWSGFNYLGYRDDYTPPWRFQYLLERARYFAEHAKNAQRDYLNFLSNAENEEYKELSAGQNVELEKANVRVENERCRQAIYERVAAAEAMQNSELVATNAEKRLAAYQNFNDGWTMLASVVQVGASTAGAIAAMAATGGAAVIVAGGAAGAGSLGSAYIESKRRDYEEASLALEVSEARQGVVVAQAQFAVANQGVVVAVLQQQAAYLRHAHAVSMLGFLRNRALNQEQWYRLAGAIRSVADTYLRYAIEAAFLAEQAYEFEADKRLDVIRFDYDQSEVGAMLAADFLLSDLDTLEQDLLTTQTSRQQNVRYVLSMAQEFPETLRELDETGVVTFALPLTSLERHFEGLHNLRIARVDVQPVALMDPTRVCVQLTQLGVGRVRLKAQPGPSVLNASDVAAADDWLNSTDTGWPIKVRVTPAESAIYTGLAREDAAGFSGLALNQRGAFEGLAGASTWRLDMSMRENQVVPGSLADVLITFVLSGYHDASLRNTVAGAIDAGRPFAATRVISARARLPDSYFSLVRYGRLEWPVTERMLALAGSPETLNNVGVQLPLAPDGVECGRAFCRYNIELMVAASNADARTPLPTFSFTSNGLTLNAQFAGVGGATATWDFGDGSALVGGAAVQHVYARPGRYTVTTWVKQGGRMASYRSAVVVSAAHQVTPPLVVTPTFSAGVADADGFIPVSVQPPAGDFALDCRAGRVRGFAASGAVELKLTPGKHIVELVASRPLRARFSCRQRYQPDAPVMLERARVASNRTFANGAETTAAANAFTAHVFGNPVQSLSPTDRWTLELPLDENEWLRSVTGADVVEFDGSEFGDAVLSLEYLAR